jgi:cytochrome c553
MKIVKKIMKWTGLGLVWLAGFIVLILGIAFLISESRFNRNYDIEKKPIEIPTDSESIEYGEHVASIRGCKACHGEDLSGEIEFQDPMFGVIANANLTGGEGSEVVGYSIQDWDRSIRHGIGPDGKPLIIMPSNKHNAMSDEDLDALLAYNQSLPPINNTMPELELAIFPRLLFIFGQIDFLVPAEIIDHTAPRPPAPERGVTVEYGAYLAGLCSLCHGEGYSGGYIPGVPTVPEEPPPRNLTPGGALSGWTFEEFLSAMRTGIEPNGYQLNDDYMPYQSLFGDMTDDEWEAIWLFLQSLPAKEFGNR